MKRLVPALLLALLTANEVGAAQAKKKSEPQVPIAKSAGEERVSPPKQRKQADPEGPPVKKHPGPVQVGPPAERLPGDDEVVRVGVVPAE